MIYFALLSVYMYIDMYVLFEHFFELMISWPDSHSGTRRKIYSIREIVVVTSSQVATGTWSFDGSMFGKADFSPWGVTDGCSEKARIIS
jgi:hypothetical protein